jgi:ribosomal protein S18 acetylase RimI-like enzyme
MKGFRVVPLAEQQRGWMEELLVEQWGSRLMVSRGRLFDVSVLPGFVAVDESGPVGLATYRIEGDACELTSLNSRVEGKGIGSALIDAVRSAAAAAGCRRLWLITTNDNTPALRFYQKRGFRLVAIHCNALEESRRLKPQISLLGIDGIPLRDELELEILLQTEDRR